MRMRRIRYTKTEGGVPKHVKYRFDEQGQEIFEERGVDEAHYHQYTPSEEERNIAHRMIDEVRLGIRYQGSLLRIDFGSINEEPD